MTAAETFKGEIERLAALLYEAKREMESADVLKGDRPVFVLVAKDTAARHEFENKMLEYLATKFGFSLGKPMPYDVNPLGTVSLFQFPSGVVLSIIDGDKIKA